MPKRDEPQLFTAAPLPVSPLDDEERFACLTPRLAQQHGIQTVYQEIELAPTLSVAENLFVGNEVLTPLGFIDYRAMASRARALLDDFGLELDVGLRVRELSPVEQEIVQIVKALSHRPKVLILDEATASFSQKEISRLLALVREVGRKGVSVIYISHHLEEVLSIAERITVLRDGRKVGCFDRAGLKVDQLITCILGNEARTFYRKRPHVPARDGAFEVRGIGKQGLLEETSFTVSSGEVLGIAGPVGAGKTELATLLFGLEKPDRGAVLHRGVEITARTPLQAIRRGICLLTENRRKDGLLLRRPISENVTFAGLWKSPGIFLRLREERRKVLSLVRRMNVKCSGIEQAPGTLSGGNQQKVVLAKWFSIEPEIYIFDEPTVGIDVGAKQEIYSLISALAEQGKILIIISSDLPELVSLCSRVLVLKKRRIIGELSDEGLSEANILQLLAGERAEGAIA